MHCGLESSDSVAVCLRMCMRVYFHVQCGSARAICRVFPACASERARVCVCACTCMCVLVCLLEHGRFNILNPREASQRSSAAERFKTRTVERLAASDKFDFVCAVVHMYIEGVQNTTRINAHYLIAK